MDGQREGRRAPHTRPRPSRAAGVCEPVKSPEGKVTIIALPREMHMGIESPSARAMRGFLSVLLVISCTVLLAEGACAEFIRAASACGQTRG